MYSIGDMVIYGEAGVCRITEISEREVFGEDGQTAMYYTMEPCYQGYMIYAPVENCKIFMRPVISKEEALSLIDHIPEIKAEPYQGVSLRELVSHYESMLKSHRCEDLFELTLSIYAKKRQCIANRRKVGAVDEKFVKRAEELLFGELAVVLGIHREDVQNYIKERVGDFNRC